MATFEVTNTDLIRLCNTAISKTVQAREEAIEKLVKTFYYQEVKKNFDSKFGRLLDKTFPTYGEKIYFEDTLQFLGKYSISKDNPCEGNYWYYTQEELYNKYKRDFSRILRKIEFLKNTTKYNQLSNYKIRLEDYEYEMLINIESYIKRNTFQF